ncbi:MAG: UvrD-helicase domain-containing protein [Oscillospiraceae bacterium]|jgi:ATP-dependent helicase/nuclease subunit A|nr:UvrD-helicase domain-containing protein [Oscillospiraceae bacterium]
MNGWTKEQERALGTRAFPEKSLLVSAAAGSGKTSVIAERARRLITGEYGERVDADKIVLVTFTRKAAAELKSRLEGALLSGLAESGDSWAEEQLVRLDDAEITTISAFCLNILRENAPAAGLEPGFGVADDTQRALLSDKAMNDALELFYGGDSDEITSLLTFFGGGGDRALRDAVRELHRFTRNLPDADGWVDEQIRLYNEPDAYYEKIVLPFSAALEEEKRRAAALIEESLRLARSDKTRAFLRKSAEFFSGGILDCPSEYPVLNVKGEDDYVKERVKENHEKAKDVGKSLISGKNLILSFKESVRMLRPYMEGLARLYRIYRECFAARKRAARVIDFEDSEQLCLELLKSNRAARERVRARCEIIIVDEFQDSNFLQYDIFKLIDGGRNRLFFVGDIKQSVYGFRGAEPRVFGQAAASGEYETVYLSNNFRSSNEVIRSVNAVFERAMPGYDDNVKLKGGRGVFGADYETEFILLDGETFPQYASGPEKEAFYTARRIREMVRTGFRVYEKGKGFRRCGWGDFAVLTSVGEKNFLVYEKVFGEAGVPCVGEGGDDYLNAKETGLALDLLSVIDNPYDDLSLLNVLMSPLCGFTAQELAKLKAERKGVPLYSALAAGGRDEGDEKAADFIRRLARFRRIADSRAVTDLFAALDGEGVFLPLTVEGSGQKRADLQLLSYYAERFAESNADGGLPAFLAYIRDLKNVGGDIKRPAVRAHGERVRLMTIHKAKGLEFPVCFVGRVNHKFNFRGTKTPPLVKPVREAGLTAYAFDSETLCRFKTLHSKYAELLGRERTVSEETRKLYVAATRAESKLIFTGFAKNGKIEENSYAALIAGAGFTAKGAADEDEPGGVVRDGARADEDKREAERETKRIIKNIAAVYPKKALSAVPRKLTATRVGVVRETTNEEANDVFPVNPSFYGSKRLTGKKRGDAYHKAMELIDFAAGDYSGQLQRARARFTPIEYKAVNAADIEGFFASELGQRAAGSGKVVKEYKLYTQIELSALGIDGRFDEKPFVQGMADMFFYENGEIVLVDYKTNRFTSPEKLTREYGGQLLLYKKAIEEMTGDRVKECWLYSFEHGAVRV